MKKFIYSISLLSALILTFSCSDDSVSEDFDKANGNVQKKLISSVAIISAQDPQENRVISMLYSSDGSLNTINNGVETRIFIYGNNDELTNITGGGDNLNILDLYESPYDAFETGDVIVYDDNGNPKKINFFEEEYNITSGTYTTKIYTADISYDDTHNPFFYTLEAAGIIDVLDGVRLNFGINPQVPEIAQARMLFPVNNPSQIIYKNEEGEIVFTINSNYVYDNENYPTSATVTKVSIEHSQQHTYSAIFEYVN
ncbi:hypothetical protein [Lutibacter citreus]|uniref:hypothetical protein n=1 Tax=Lutibacter citreus TaxID=2138210 RepID=UPI000DBE577F|nr:hypothetical protein [Lutibacter citreus]